MSGSRLSLLSAVAAVTESLNHRFCISFVFMLVSEGRFKVKSGSLTPPPPPPRVQEVWTRCCVPCRHCGCRLPPGAAPPESQVTPIILCQWRPLGTRPGWALGAVAGAPRWHVALWSRGRLRRDS